jgi:hypothetical protein
MTRCHSLILGYAYKCVVSQQDDNNGRYGGNVSRGVSDLAVRVADDEASFGFFGHPRWREIGLTPETASPLGSANYSKHLLKLLDVTPGSYGKYTEWLYRDGSEHARTTSRVMD